MTVKKRSVHNIAKKSRKIVYVHLEMDAANPQLHLSQVFCFKFFRFPFCTDLTKLIDKQVGNSAERDRAR